MPHPGPGRGKPPPARRSRARLHVYLLCVAAAMIVDPTMQTGQEPAARVHPFIGLGFGPSKFCLQVDCCQLRTFLALVAAFLAHEAKLKVSRVSFEALFLTKIVGHKDLRF